MRLRTLIIEDSEEDALLLLLHLRQGGIEPDHERVDSPERLRAALAARRWDVVLSDYHLPRFDGLDALRLVREKDADLPFILISGTVGEEHAVEAMRRGANDYLIKGSLARLNSVVTREIREATQRRGRRRTEEALRDLSSRQQTLLAAIPDIIAEVDKNKTYAWMNPAGLDFFGEDAIGKEAAYYFEGAQDTYGAVAPVFKGNKDVVYLESWQRRKDGEKRLLAWWCRVLEDGEGKVIGALSTARDITELRRTDAALRESQQFIEGIINAIPVRVFWKDKNLVYLGCNTIFAQDAGFKSSRDIIGHDDYHMGWRDQADLYRGDDLQVIASGRPKLLIEEPQTTPSGETIVLLTSKIPLRSDAGEIIGVLGTYMDITERKKSEAILANIQKLESLGLLAGGIAHDFNNILTAILGNLSLLQSELKAGGEALELIREAQEACAMAKGLSHQLLTFAKGGSPVVRVADLRPLIVQSSGFAARGSNARCIFDLGESPLPVSVDSGQVFQVIQNLTINAIQAMPEGGDITIRAAVVVLDDKELPPLAAGRYVRVTVQDQGTGISAETIPGVFDPYFSTKASGRGLGLAVCYSIMTKHGGHISAESKPGSGAVFILHFPLADVADLVPQGDCPVRAVGSGRVLIMDDEAAIAKVLTRMLASLGYQAESAGDGKEALDVYRQAMLAGKRFDAVIMDLTIPGGMGGKEAIGLLLAFDPDAKVIVSSGYSDDPIMSEYAASGFRGALSKPYDIEDVSEVLRRIIASKRAGA